MLTSLTIKKGELADVELPILRRVNVITRSATTGSLALDILLKEIMSKQPYHYMDNILFSARGFNDGLLISEGIEEGLHYSMYPSIAEHLDLVTSLNNCQAVVTTHSRELIFAFHDYFQAKDEYDLIFYRFDHSEKRGFWMAQYDQDVLQAAIASDFEVR